MNTAALEVFIWSVMNALRDFVPAGEKIHFDLVVTQSIIKDFPHISAGYWSDMNGDRMNTIHFDVTMPEEMPEQIFTYAD